MMPYRVPATLDLSETEQAELEGWARRRKMAQALALRARIVLRAAAGSSNTAIAAELGIAKHTVGKWRERFAKDRLEGLQDQPRSGAPRTVTDERVAGLLVRTLEATPEDVTHWSTRSWPRPAGSPRPRCSGSGAPLASSRTGPRASRPPPTPSSPRRCATSSGCT